MRTIFLLLFFSRALATQYECSTTPCVRKCCPLNEEYDRKIKACRNATKSLVLPVGNGGVREAEVVAGWKVLVGILHCPDGQSRFPVSKTTAKVETIRITRDGSMQYSLPHKLFRTKSYTPEQYCVDNMADTETGNVTINALFCYVSVETTRADRTISTIGMLISSVFILLTLCVYAALPELNNMHGRVLMAYLASLLVGFVLLPTLQLIHRNPQKEQSYLCLPFTFIIYYSMLAAFFWLNVMCFDTWRAFNGNPGNVSRGLMKSRYLWYCLYAFGCPLVLTAVLAGMEFSEPASDYVVVPALRGNNTCFLSDEMLFLYLHIPMLILCIANITIFVATAVRISRLRGQTAVLRKEDISKNQKNEQRLLIYVKLFAVMGVSWILEVISALYPNVPYLWTITDAYNVLMGLTIFLIFICKRRTFKLIKKRFRSVRGLQPSSQTSTSTRNTSVSRDEFKMQSYP